MDHQESFQVGSIALECRKKIAGLLAATKPEDCPVKEFLHVREVQRMQQRYIQWAGKFGALQDFRSSLSLGHRLQDDPMIKKSIVKTLTDLNSSVQTGKRSSFLRSLG